MNEIYAAIDLGSNNMKLKIVQYENNHFTVLDNLTKPIGIGNGVFTLGYVEHERVKDISETLLMFKEIMESYGVDKYKAVATGAMRTARNGLNVIEVLEKNTGIHVDIIEDTIEKHLTYKSIRDNIKDYKSIRKSSIIVELNTGSCDISAYSQNALVFNEEFMLGTLILKNYMNEIESRSIFYPKVIDELIHSRTNHIWHNIKLKRIKNFMAIGGEVRLMKRYIFDNKEKVSREEFDQVYHRIINDHRTYRKELETCPMDWYEFVASVLVYNTFFKFLKTEEILFPDITLRDGIITELVEEDHPSNRYQVFRNDILSLARNISKKYRSSIEHCKNLEKNAMIIYEALCKEYYFEKKDLTLLRLSAILHEIGKFTRMKEYYTTSFEKIRNLSIMGMTHHDMLLVAYICRVMNNGDSELNEFTGLSEQEHNLVFKIASILSLADTLDKSKTQKIILEKAIVKNEILELRITHTRDITLEEWEFSNRKHQFINTFGIVPNLSIK
jgi:exopolyphosphatase/guanosine-5'-triphosphate,3'-diphosphate pyrophosphatase